MKKFVQKIWTLVLGFAQQNCKCCLLLVNIKDEKICAKDMNICSWLFSTKSLSAVLDENLQARMSNIHQDSRRK